MESLIRRGLPAPELLVSDGHRGLTKALEAWPGVKVQRCTQRKWANLVKACPKHAHRELKREWNAIIYAKSGMKTPSAYDAFVKKWKRLCAPVARSIEEAGLSLLTFYDFPKEMWKGLRSTNSIENLKREFRRRARTQGSFSTDNSALTLLFRFVAFGQIKLHKITGHRHVARLLAQKQAVAVA